MRGSDGKLYLSEKQSAILWKDYIKRIMTEENYCNHNLERDAVEGPAVKVEVPEALSENGKSPWTFRCIIGVECCL